MVGLIKCENPNKDSFVNLQKGWDNFLLLLKGTQMVMACLYSRAAKLRAQFIVSLPGLVFVG